MSETRHLNGDHGIIHYEGLSKEQERSIREHYYQRSTDSQKSYESKHTQYYNLSHYDPEQASQTPHQKGQKLNRVRSVLRSIFGSRGQNYGFQKFDALARKEGVESLPQVDLRTQTTSQATVSTQTTSTQQTVAATQTTLEPRLVTKENGETVVQVPLHHALGTKYMDEGGTVCIMRIAGSGFANYRSQQKGFKGEDKEPDTEAFKAAYGEKILGDQGTLGGVWKKKKKALVTVGNTTKEKEYTEYNMSGPLALGGALDWGKTSIDSLVEYINNYGFEYFDGVFKSQEWKDADPKYNVNLLIEGHSRGAVAISVAIKKLMDKVAEKYPEDVKFARVNMIQNDPVPGPTHIINEKAEIDLRGIQGQVNTTTVCSVYTEHWFLQFTPQKVRGQTRIILNAEKHSVNMDQGDTSQQREDEVDEIRKKPLFDGMTGHAYRGSGLSELPKGIFMQEENGALARMRSFAQARKAVRETRGFKLMARAREKNINKMVKDWFYDNEYVDETETDDVYFGELRRVDTIIEKLMSDKWRLRDSDQMKKLKAAVLAAKNSRSRDLELNVRETYYNLAIDKCKGYLDNHNPTTDSGLERLDMVSEILSQFRAELYRMKNGKPFKI